MQNGLIVSKGKRIPYFDLAKGILILLVVLHHIHMHGYSIMHETRVSALFDILDDYWVMWFMPCFFLITGLCSNFQKKVSSFLVSNLKTLVLPNCVLGFVYLLVCQCTIGGGYYLHECKMFFVRDLLNGGYFWFLSSLFVCKVIYFVQYKSMGGAKETKSQLIIIIVALVLALVGYYLGHLRLTNIWSFKQALIYLPLLSIGNVLKENHSIESSFKYSIPCFIISVLSVVLYHFFQLPVPYVSYAFNYSIESVIPLLLLSCLGSYGFLGICKIIGKSTFFEYVGRNSLIFYMTHILIIQIVFTIAASYIDISSIGNDIFVYCIGLISVFILGSVCSWLLNRNYIRIVLGKF